MPDDTDDSDLMITITDVRRVFCVEGARDWAKSQGLNFRHFVKHGILVSEIMGRGDDALVHRVITAKKDANRG